MKKFYLILIFLLSLLSLNNCFAQTEVCGNITDKTIWTKDNSPYIVTGIINVYSGSTLIIESGVVVKLGKDISIMISGELIVKGDGINSISFIQNREGVRWGTIKFLDSSVDATYDDEGNFVSGSIIEYAKIEGAGHSGIYCKSSSPFISKNTISGNLAAYDGVSVYGGGGIYCEYSSLKISKNTISNNQSITCGGGIYCSKSSPKIYKNTILNNSGSGIYCDNSSPFISENIITDNNTNSGGGGICCVNCNAFYIISGNTISNNSARSGGGINCISCYASHTISKNIITGNEAVYGGGIYCGGYSKIYENIITGNEAVAYNGGGMCGGGIYCGNQWNWISPEISYNNIFNNKGFDIYVSDETSYINKMENINAKNNYWGVSDKNWIDKFCIYDYCDDTTSAKIYYEPFLTSATPINITSIELKTDSSYSTNLTTTLSFLDTLYIELNGTDGKKSHQDTTIVFVINESKSDSISIKLIETSLNSGIYRGIAFIQDESNNEKDIIGVSLGDIIKIFSVVNASIYDSVIVSETTSIELLSKKIPNEYKLFQNYPNTFNPETRIKYEIPKTTNVEIAVYNILGQKIKTLLNETKNPGAYKILWDGTNERGINVSSGIYLYIIKTKDFFALKKMVLLR